MNTDSGKNSKVFTLGQNGYSSSVRIWSLDSQVFAHLVEQLGLRYQAVQCGVGSTVHQYWYLRVRMLLEHGIVGRVVDTHMLPSGVLSTARWPMLWPWHALKRLG